MGPADNHAAADTLHTVVTGEGSPLLLLHPVGTDGTIWGEIAELLSRRFRVLAVDLPGHGRSSAGTLPLSIHGMAQRATRTLAASACPPAHVVGLSVGGMVAQSLALQSPASVRSLVLVGTSCHVSPAASEALEARARAVETGGMAAIIEDTLARWFSPAFRETQPTTVSRVRAMLLACDPAINAATWRAIKNFSVADRFTEPPPSLVVYGELEARAAPENGIRLAASVKGHLVEIPGAAHISPLEAPAQFVRLIEQFVDELPVETHHSQRGQSHGNQ